MQKDNTDNWNMVPEFDFECHEPDPQTIEIYSIQGTRLPFMKEGDRFFLIFNKDTTCEIAEEIHSLLSKHVAYLQFTGEKRSGIPQGLGEQRKASNGGKS